MARSANRLGRRVVTVELSSQKIPASVVWTREGTVGVKFDQNIDLGELLAGRKPRHGFRPRPPRLEVSCKASLRVEKTYYTVRRARHFARRNEGRADRGILPRQESRSRGREPSPGRGEVRWYSDRLPGSCSISRLTFEELASGSASASSSPASRRLTKASARLVPIMRSLLSLQSKGAGYGRTNRCFRGRMLSGAPKPCSTMLSG